MFATTNFGFADTVNLNLDAARPLVANRTRYQSHQKAAISRDDIFTHVNMQALEGLGVETSQAVQLRFTVAPLVNPFKGETNWKVIVDPRTTDRERSAITHAAKNVQRIFDLVDGYQNVRALII